jgi:nicotinate-nucleotide pyrophosphorylase (carboxylating)
MGEGNVGEELRALVRRALAEDIGDGDVTTDAIVAPDARGGALIVQKEPGAIYGLDAAEAAFALLDHGVRFERLAQEGRWREEGGPVLSIEGSARALLSGERTALNFLAHLSGVATLAARAVRAVEGTGVRVLDTRKTTPGLRTLEKAAVAAGGACNHRAGLYDAILIKENHIVAAGGIAQAVARAREGAGETQAEDAHAREDPIRAREGATHTRGGSSDLAAHIHEGSPDLAARTREGSPGKAATLEVEVRDPLEIEQALAAGARRLLLDNMSVDELRDAVVQVGGRAELEASGNVTLENLRERALTGVDFISMGALTHSAPALDLSMIVQALP